ncbi:sulfatase [Amphibacillus sediminis]|uniref:sulfatase n=1 Tax=Amphibacillus sediminis TaxID=360185 RepID=UPI00082ED89B|nr:sulfatase [Amphibacillus sediminis]
MRVIQVMFDTLKRNYLTPYEMNDVYTPNFERLAKKTVRFDNFFAGSLPCMPARRDLHTGRYNFLHRGWGPIEPFDDSMPEILKQHGIYTHLVTDHKHYWRDGGATYHPRYSSYEFIRGQEGDSWKGMVNKPFQLKDLDKLGEEGASRKFTSMSQDFVNRTYMPEEKDHMMYRTFDAGLEFLQTNVDADDWFLQIESFDPHEPFFVPKKYLDMYDVTEDEFNGWLLYSYDDFSPEKIDIIKKYYKALITMCDVYLGKVLDFMDEHNMWEDTMLIVNTDHGLLLGEHEWWGKNIMPVYNEIAHLPFFIWYPQLERKGEAVSQLAQTIDIPATILDFFEIDLPKDMKGRPLRDIVESDQPIHDAVLFGYFGSNLNITDGEYVYMRAPVPEQEHVLKEYTLSPMRINRRFTLDELKDAKLNDSFSFTKGIGVLELPSQDIMAKNYQRFGHKLFNYQEDPQQLHALLDAEKEFKMIEMMKRLLRENEAPSSLYTYFGLDKINSVDDVKKEHDQFNKFKKAVCEDLSFCNSGAKEGYLTLYELLKDNEEQQNKLKEDLVKQNAEAIDCSSLIAWVQKNIPSADQSFVLYQLNLSMRTS